MTKKGPPTVSSESEEESKGDRTIRDSETDHNFGNAKEKEEIDFGDIA